MLTFLMACLSLYLSLKALDKGIKHAKKAKESSYDSNHDEQDVHNQGKSNIYSFLSSQDSTKIFKETFTLFNEAIQKSIEEDSFGYHNHHTTLCKNVYNYKIQLTVQPTELKWEVFDLAQNEKLHSHRAYTIVYDRSLKRIKVDEFRINEGENYRHDSLLSYNVLPFDIINMFNTLNEAGWNKISSVPEEVKTTPLSNELKPYSNKFQSTLESNKDEIDQEVYTLFSNILSLVNKICDDEQANNFFNDYDNVELKHNLKRLFETELTTILHTYLMLDDTYKTQSNSMVLKSLNKVYNRLIEQYASLQQEYVSTIKQTHLLMEERYD